MHIQKPSKERIYFYILIGAIYFHQSPSCLCLIYLNCVGKVLDNLLEAMAGKPMKALSMHIQKPL